MESLSTEGSTTRFRCPEHRRCYEMRRMRTYSATELRRLGNERTLTKLWREKQQVWSFGWSGHMLN